MDAIRTTVADDLGEALDRILDDHLDEARALVGGGSMANVLLMQMARDVLDERVAQETAISRAVAAQRVLGVAAG